jgi:hypothetical protein
MTEPLIQPSPTSSPAKAARSTEHLDGDDPVPYPKTRDRVRTDLDRDSPPGTPRWVKVSGVVAIVLFLLVAGLHLTGHTPTHGMPMPMHDIQAP